MLVLFMNFTFGDGQIICTTESDIADNELLQVTPEHVSRYLKYRAYGTADPGADVMPNKCRSSSLMYWKKALSYCMPNGLQHWNVAANSSSTSSERGDQEVICVFTDWVTFFD